MSGFSSYRKHLGELYFLYLTGLALRGAVASHERVRQCSVGQ